jgi:hypothetical protein
LSTVLLGKCIQELIPQMGVNTSTNQMQLLLNNCSENHLQANGAVQHHLTTV